MSQAVFDSLSHQQQTDIRLFADRLATQNRSLNMVAPSTLDDLWDRHILDSLQLVPHVESLLPENQPASVLDIGTGGGLPAVPVALAFASNINISVQALDSDQKKIAAIRLMTLGLCATVGLYASRVEAHKVRHDVIVSRALASLEKLLSWARPILKSAGHMVLLKGERYEEEVTEARQRWDFDLKTHQSVTNPQAAVLILSNIRLKNH